MSPLPNENAAYYWRTTWSLDSTELDFLSRHNITKLYCRFFDVVMADDSLPMPNATIRFPDDWSAGVSLADMGDSANGATEGDAAERLPEGMELVPTVYITEDCMHTPAATLPAASPSEKATVPAGFPAGEALPAKLVNRILQIAETHSLPPIHEIQIDCDYTLRSRKTYYDFLNQVRSEAARHSLRLSTTIRLHQLSMPAPPADYGVLMVYNTGDPRKFAERNPILDIRDVQPYMRYLPDYPLPLAAAYPVYSWQRYIAGVRVEHTVDSTEITSVKHLVEKTRPDIANTIITYHLDKENIKRYNYETYCEIYRH